MLSNLTSWNIAWPDCSKNNGGTGHDEFLSSHGQSGCLLLGSSGDFFEVAEAEGLTTLPSAAAVRFVQMSIASLLRREELDFATDYQLWSVVAYAKLRYY